MNKKFSNSIFLEILICISALFLIILVSKLQSVHLFIIAILVVLAVVLRFKKGNKTKVSQPTPASTQVQEKRIPTQKDVYTLAYSVILRQITAFVLNKYPNARWIWEAPDSKNRIEKGEDIYILLNSAGGYKRAKVVISNLQVTDILFGVSPEEHNDIANGEDDEPMAENYELLAFEWVETHIVALNARVNEAIGKGKSEMLIKSSELPTRDSWDDIRYALEKENIADTKCIPDGILIKLKR